ncbi:hypothetical protein OMCYN_01618 [cyanobiont of Ornithocercus magnificus]|nr:hypothetical protein OMCYN_01618 [cyanobiont of Ornithocercus magnificus]
MSTQVTDIEALASDTRSVILPSATTGSVPKKPRVLFFHGQYTNPKIAFYLLHVTGFTKVFDFVIPRAIYDDIACPNNLRDSVGLAPLIRKGVYDFNDTFFSWGARWDLTSTRPCDISTEISARYLHDNIRYVKNLVEQYGPFDGIMGMCEGGTTLQAVMFEQAAGRTNALGEIKFHIHLAAWTSGLSRPRMLSLPTLAIGGRNDLRDFQEAFKRYKNNFNGYYAEFMHSGGHNYPRVTRALKDEIQKLLAAGHTSGMLLPLPGQPSHRRLQIA